MKAIIPIIALLISLEIGTPASPLIVLKLVASGLASPVDITHAGDARLFVVEKQGLIRIIDSNNELISTPFLDINTSVNASGSERGLLGLAFHPDYANNGYFFVNYTDANGDTQISRFSISEDDTNIADTNSEVLILNIEQPFSNHNAGDLAFGPDGFLYIGLGDGGGAGDPGDRSQAKSELLGKMLRIDIDSGTPYAIPVDNPFIDEPLSRPEIWALGLRNPWRHSFDRETGDLWIADVGQGDWEEINYQAAPSTGGANYGWRCYEANVSFNTAGCSPVSQYTAPVHAYNHNGDSCSITGGFVYRGESYPDLIGNYIFADYCSGLISALVPKSSGVWVERDLLGWHNYEISSFGEGQDGELYMSAINRGEILKITTQIN